MNKQTLVIKLGGALIESDEALTALFATLKTFLDEQHRPLVLVHGGDGKGARYVTNASDLRGAGALDGKLSETYAVGVVPAAVVAGAVSSHLMSA